MSTFCQFCSAEAVEELSQKIYGRTYGGTYGELLRCGECRRVWPKTETSLEFLKTKTSYCVPMSRAQWAVLVRADFMDFEANTVPLETCEGITRVLEKAGCENVEWNGHFGQNLFFTCESEHEEFAFRAVRQLFSRCPIQQVAVENVETVLPVKKPEWVKSLKETHEAYTQRLRALEAVHRLEATGMPIGEIGGTLQQELERTAEMVVEITGRLGVFYAVALLHDSSYGNDRLKSLIPVLQEQQGACLKEVRMS